MIIEWLILNCFLFVLISNFLLLLLLMLFNICNLFIGLGLVNKNFMLLFIINDDKWKILLGLFLFLRMLICFFVLLFLI